MAVGTGTALIASALIGGGAAYLGAKEQAKAIKKATSTEQAFQNRLLDFQKEAYSGGQPFRDVALETLPTLKDYVMNPTISPSFKLAGEEGLNLISSEAATAGSPTSGPAQIAKGRFMSGLASSESDRMMNNLFRLAGFTTGVSSETTSQAGNILGTAGGVAGNIANLQTMQGAVSGGLYGSIGQTIGQLPYMYSLYNMMNNPPPTTGTIPHQPSGGSYFPSMNEYYSPSRWGGGGMT